MAPSRCHCQVTPRLGFHHPTAVTGPGAVVGTAGGVVGAGGDGVVDGTVAGTVVRFGFSSRCDMAGGRREDCSCMGAEQAAISTDADATMRTRVARGMAQSSALAAQRCSSGPRKFALHRWKQRSLLKDGAAIRRYGAADRWNGPGPVAREGERNCPLDRPGCRRRRG